MYVRGECTCGWPCFVASSFPELCPDDLVQLGRTRHPAPIATTCRLDLLVAVSRDGGVTWKLTMDYDDELTCDELRRGLTRREEGS